MIFLVSQVVRTRGSWNVKHTGWFLQKGCITCYLPRRLGADLPGDQCAFCVVLILPQTLIISLLVSVSLYILSLWKMPNVLYKEFQCSHVGSFRRLLCSSRRVLYVLTVHMGLSWIALGTFHQIVLCFNMLK